MYASVKKVYNYFRNYFLLRKIVSQQMMSYLKGQKEEKGVLEMHLLLLTHSLEKGMLLQQLGSRNSKAYGIEKARKLCNLLLEYESKYADHIYAYCEGRSILDKYIENQESYGISVGDLKSKVQMLDAEYQFLMSGFHIVKRDELLKGEKFDFDEFIGTKHSIREFKDEQVDVNIIEDAVRIANMSPSACNRQPIEIYYSLNDKIISEIERLVPGNKACGNIPNYLVVTVKKNYFDVKEFSQWYVNGGIYVAYLTLALHSKGIGSCIFQWPVCSESDAVIKKCLDIKCENEIVAVIGIGHYPDENKCIYACRKKSEETLFLR